MRILLRTTQLFGIVTSLVLPFSSWAQVLSHQQLDSLATRVMGTFNVPGLALAIIKD